MNNIYKICVSMFVCCLISLCCYSQTDTIKASFPGGEIAWRKYLERKLNTMVAPRSGAPAGIYTVVVTFEIDEHGLVSKAKADKDPGYGYAKAAELLIKKGPKWIPAQVNGVPVPFTHKQSITFVNM
jgi:protein TonB